ncbi:MULTISPECIES: hypothetical protein [Paenibacillus]|uniref:hypothetical protein n=1 Tax=Paenibacillus TaxID=44249 RepID=UPI000B82F588|nr:hypothetical protein [Paenibacillus amylolyticus]
MSTYDGAYTNKNADYGILKICCCNEEVNDFCDYHGKYKDGGFKKSKEYIELKKKLTNNQS